MINNIAKIVKTFIVRCFHFGKIKTKGLLDIYHDTKIKITDNGMINKKKNT